MKKNGTINIHRKVVRNGIEVSVNRKKYVLAYPSNIWDQYPSGYRQIFADSLAFFFTKHLSLVDHQELVYHFPPPSTAPFFFQGILYSLPETAIVEGNGITVAGLIKKFYNSEFKTRFTRRPNKTRMKNVNRNFFKRAIIPFTFGKDSLLTFALSQELGIRPYPVFFREPRSPYENRHKVRLARKFHDEFDYKIDFFPVSAGWLRQVTDMYWGWDLLLTQYTLLLIPYIFALRSKYLFWAHEQSCNETFKHNEGYIVNPVYEQSNNWLVLSNSVAKTLGCNATFASLIEPIHEIAVTKILHSRYPDLAKYQSSCFEDEDQAKTRRWCGVCSKCARIYIFFLALGINPKKVCFNENMLQQNKRKHYTLFLDGELKDSAYSKSTAARDEQLLAFTMAYRKGWRKGLMAEYEKNFKKEGLARENELRNKYFSIHSTNSLTYGLKKGVLKIFQEELAKEK